MNILSQDSVFIIAEAGVNHNGSVKLAEELIDEAQKSGASAIKFQTFRTEKLVSRNAEKAEYQKKTVSDGETQFDMLKKLELTEQEFRHLFHYAAKKGIQMLSTPFDEDSLKFLVEGLDVPLIKVSSGDLTNAPFLLSIARTGKKILLSTGMSTLREIEEALSVLAFGYLVPNKYPTREALQLIYSSSEGQSVLRENVTLLHCTTEYPTPVSDVNLLVIDTFRTAFGLPTGLSDHTAGIAIPIAAVARGAVVIEKHFTLDKNLPGPDHKASLNPEELRNLVNAVREVRLALGTSVKRLAPSEFKNISAARKSVVAKRKIKKGEIFSEENLTIKRPGTGLSPFYYWDLIGKKAMRDYLPDEVIV